MKLITHPFEPIYTSESKILILGTMPSPVSRRNNFYYSHPQNRFWQVLASIFSESIPQTINDKRHLLICHHIALWDVLASCEIMGASDASIKNPITNDFLKIITETKITISPGRIFAAGTKAFTLYTHLCLPQTGMQASLLPSTSSANARFSLQKLIQAYAFILKFL